jgi:thioredoxin-like negative regulator of GroEL
LSRIFGVFLISFVLTFVNASDERRPVMHLTDDNILTEMSGSTDVWLMYFHVDWSLECRRLVPIFDQLAEALGDTVRVSKVMAEQAQHTVQRFGVSTFPTIKVVRMGMVYSYSGPSIYEHVYAFAHGGYMDADGGGEPLKAPRPPLPLFQSDTKEEL